MSVPPFNEPGLPETLEDAILAILEGDDTKRDASLRRLVDEHPQHAKTIRAWMSSAGIEISTAGEQADPDPDALPRDLGVYRLLERIGRGGFGTVYRAEQREPIQRVVAVKLINPGMDSREILARFHAEREALNRMDHLGIARLLDAGATAQGRPFFVMELVEGPTLIALCRQRGLDHRQRLGLFAMVLDAMQHAHQKAVIHRDLSSNNVLITERDGHLQPKIIDFGIAKSLADPLLHGGAMTFQGTLMGTPEFMSPEQAAGRVTDIDTRADVYALGVQLYELLTDQLPIPGVMLRAHGPAGMAELIQTHRPEPPSAVVDRKRQSALRGDLDAITMKALAKSREERYASVAALAADIANHLDNRPVQVAEPSTWRRFCKLVRRHRMESALLGLATLGLVAATGALWWAWSIAKSGLDESQRQKQEIERRADAGFRLLANEERLISALAAASTLPPPWPEHENTLREWMEQHGTPLEQERSKLRSKLADLELTRDAEGNFEDMVDAHLYSALQRLDDRMAAFTSPSGPLARVRSQLAFLQDVVKPSLVRHEPLWQRTIQHVREEYHGLRLRPMPGLEPVPVEGTQARFRDLATGGNDSAITFALIPGGRFLIGARRGEPGLPQNDDHAQDNELGGEQIGLDDFLIAEKELTQAQWARLTGAPPPPAEVADLPATGIDWYTAREVLQQYAMDLPTEAQWEYACRGNEMKYPWSIGNTEQQMKTNGNFGTAPEDVGQHAPNRYGLHDMHGNVAEWCRDQMLSYRDSEVRTGDGLRTTASPPHDANRIVRGGACYQGVLAARSTARDAKAPTTRDSAIGIRPIRQLR